PSSRLRHPLSSLLRPGPARALHAFPHDALPILAALAERHFADADAAMARCSRRAMRPAAVMGAFYHAMLDALLRAGWRDPAVRLDRKSTRLDCSHPTISCAVFCLKKKQTPVLGC